MEGYCKIYNMIVIYSNIYNGKHARSFILLVTTHVLINVLLFPACVRTHQYKDANLLGNCYKIRRSDNPQTCKRIAMTSVTKEACCSSKRYRAWSGPHDLTNVTAPICQPCQYFCSSKTCNGDQQCIITPGNVKCICKPQCQLKYKSTVCGNDGRTYKTECHLLKRSCRKKKRLFISHNGPCETCSGVRCGKNKKCVLDDLLVPRCVRCPTRCPIPKRERFICGVDGQIYSSKCQLRLASCQVGYDVTKAYKGKCRPDANCDNVKCDTGARCLEDEYSGGPQCIFCSQLSECLPAPRHVCASDGKSYHSKCALRHEGCRSGHLLAAVPQSLCHNNQTDVENTIRNCIYLLNNSKNTKSRRRKNKQKIMKRSISAHLKRLDSGEDGVYNQYNTSYDLQFHANKASTAEEENPLRPYSYYKFKSKTNKWILKDCRHIVLGRFTLKYQPFSTP